MAVHNGQLFDKKGQNSHTYFSLSQQTVWNHETFQCNTTKSLFILSESINALITSCTVQWKVHIHNFEPFVMARHGVYNVV